MQSDHLNDDKNEYNTGISYSLATETTEQTRYLLVSSAVNSSRESVELLSHVAHVGLCVR